MELAFNPAQAECEGGPNGPPILGRSISRGFPEQLLRRVLGRRLPAFAIPPIPGQRRLLSSLLLLGVNIGLLLVLCMRARQEQAGRTAHCVLPDAGRTQPRMSPR